MMKAGENRLRTNIIILKTQIYALQKYCNKMEKVATGEAYIDLSFAGFDDEWMLNCIVEKLSELISAIEEE